MKSLSRVSFARTAFENYLQYFLSGEQEFNIATLDGFYDHCMAFSYWRENKVELSAHIRKLLEATTISSLQEVGTHADEIQWLTIEQKRDFKALLDEENLILLKNQERVECFELDAERILRLRLNSKNELTAEVKVNYGFLEKTHVQLLRPLTQLSYSPDLELNESRRQKLYVGLDRWALFQVYGEKSNPRIKGQIVQGHLFMPQEGFDGELKQNWDILKNLKAIEKHFISAHTDPFYMNLIFDLEKSINVSILDLNELHSAKKILVHAERALQDIFTHDKALSLLVSKLKHKLVMSESSHYVIIKNSPE